MVDVGDKDVSSRRAVARALVQLSPEAAEQLRHADLPKGSPREVVRLAGIQAAKQTANLIPLCHPLRLTGVQIELEEAGDDRWQIRATVTAMDRTGVEMEALTAASISALALYDMVKAVDRTASILEVCLLEKSGGKSGEYRREENRRENA